MARYRVTFVKLTLAGRRRQVFTFALADSPEQATERVRAHHHVVRVIEIREA